jgi:hypothetical protein
MGSATETREGNRVPLTNKEVGLAQPKPSGTDHSDSISCINLMCAVRHLWCGLPALLRVEEDSVILTGTSRSRRPVNEGG